MSETPSQQTTDASTDKPSSVTGGDKPRVLIVGAGLAGLMLALLLEKINIPYQVFERASKIRPLGSALSLGANILPVFEQLGMLQDIIDISYPVLSQVLYDANMKQIGKMSMKDYKGVTGYDTLVFARPQLHELMLSRVPAEKVLMNKKVLSIEQNQLGAMIRCNDNTQYHGDIIVGADGAYSGVRQALYKRLEAKGMLPKSDAESLEAGFITMVGTTDPLDPQRYPCLKEPVVDFSVVIGGQHLSWVTLTLPNNRVGWGVAIQFATPEEAKEVQFRNSEWGPEAIEEMIGRFRDRKLPIGGTIGDLIDATPKDLISKVYLDEKMFETWHHGRTVLIGDACHKMLLSAGQGAINAMQDSVILANAIYDLKSSNPDELKEAFQSYQTQRYPHAKFQYMNSKMVSKLMTGQRMVLAYGDASKNVKVAATSYFRPEDTKAPLEKEE
ncbi:hypothetical protein BGZ58_003639 [Dissophora ornata]|nr:hypothetical protein BGZ58_003639 [Dissophora ornata]